LVETFCLIVRELIAIKRQTIVQVKYFLAVAFEIVGIVSLLKSGHRNITAIFRRHKDCEVFNLYPNEFLALVGLFLMMLEGIKVHPLAVNKCRGVKAQIFFRIDALP
jgi:hypothetical protein